MKTLGKIANLILYELTYPTANRWRRTLKNWTLKTNVENRPSSKTKLCNCLRKENCLMKGTCLTENVLYYSKISCHDEKCERKLNKGICEITFKKSYTNHKKSFSTKKKNDTTLYTEYYKLAYNKPHPMISWSIKGKYISYNLNSKRCSFCLRGKVKKFHVINRQLNKSAKYDITV